MVQLGFTGTKIDNQDTVKKVLDFMKKENT